MSQYTENVQPAQENMYLIEYHDSKRRAIMIAANEDELRSKVSEQTCQNFNIVRILATGTNGYFPYLPLEIHDID